MNRLSPQVRKLLALGILSVLLFSVWAMGFRPLLAAAETAIERLHDARFERDRARLAVGDRKKVSEELIAAEEHEMQQRLQTGDSPSNAIGALQASVDRIARESGLQLENMAAEPLAVKEPLTKLAVVLKAKGSETALIKMLSAMESQPALMVLERLTIVAQDAAQAGNGKAVSLAVELRIAGYWARPQPAVKAKS